MLYEGGLPAGLEWLARWLLENHAFTLELTLTCTPVLPDDVKILVFESIRELVFNVIKHAG